MEVNAATVTRTDGELMFAVQYQSYQEAMASPALELTVTSETGTVDAHIRPGYCYRILTPSPTSLDLEGVTLSLPESGTVPVNDFVTLECVHGAEVVMVVN